MSMPCGPSMRNCREFTQPHTHVRAYAGRVATRAAVLELPGGFCYDSLGNSDSVSATEEEYTGSDCGNPLIYTHQSTQCGPECCSNDGTHMDCPAGANEYASTKKVCASDSVSGTISEQTQSCYEKCFEEKSVRACVCGVRTRVSLE